MKVFDHGPRRTSEADARNPMASGAGNLAGLRVLGNAISWPDAALLTVYHRLPETGKGLPETGKVIDEPLAKTPAHG